MKTQRMTERTIKNFLCLPEILIGMQVELRDRQFIKELSLLITNDYRDHHGKLPDKFYVGLKDKKHLVYGYHSLYDAHFVETRIIKMLEEYWLRYRSLLALEDLTRLLNSEYESVMLECLHPQTWEVIRQYTQ